MHRFNVKDMSEEAAASSLTESMSMSMKLSPDLDAPEAISEAEDLDELVEQIASEDPPTRFFGIQSLRRRITDDCETSYAKLIRTKAFDVIVQGLSCEDLPDMQYECAWVLNSLLSGHRPEKPDLLTRCDALCQPLVKLLAKAADRIREQACWALSSIVSESAELRDRALGCDLVPALTAIWASKPSTGILDASALLLVNLFRELQPRIDFEAVKTLLPFMVKLLDDPHRAVAPNVVWALSYMIEDSETRIRLMLQEEILNHLRRYLTVKDEELLVPTLRVFGNISSKMNLLPSCVLADGLLAKMRPMLDHPEQKVRRQVLFFVSNISDGSDSNLQQIVDAGYLPKVGSTLLEGDEIEKREAFWIVPNLIITRGCKFKKLVIDTCLEGFFEVLTLEDPELTNCVLLTVRELMLGAIQHAEWGIDFEALRKKIEHCGGLKKIEMVQKIGDKELAKMSYQIIEDFFWNKGKKYLNLPDEDEEHEDDKIQTTPQSQQPVQEQPVSQQ